MTIETTSVKTLDEYSAECFEASANNGFWDGGTDLTPEKYSEKLLLVVSELVEAQDELRNGHSVDEIYLGPDGKPEGFPVEVMDAVIRLFDLMGSRDWDIESLYNLKREYNKGRGYRHNKEF